MDETNRRDLQRADTVLFMGGITALTAISIDIVLPATGVVARSFDLEPQMGALLVGLYFIAYAFGQLFWGLFSDAFGRRLALLLSLSGFTLASVVCAFAPSFTVLLIARFAQGLMGGAPVIARAMVRDIASGNEAARMMTLLGAILTVATMLAPVIGSSLLLLFGWRSIFFGLTIISLSFIAYTILYLPKSEQNRRPERFTFGFLRQAGAYLLTNRLFLRPMAAGSLTFGGYASVGAVGAVIAESKYGVSPEAFGALFALAAIVNTGAALLARELLKRMPLVRVGTVGLSLLSIAVLVQLMLLFADPNLQVFWAGVCLYVLAFGIIYPTSMASAMEPAGEMPGFAASVMGAIQMCIGFLSATLASATFDGSHRAIAINMLVFGALAIIAVFLGRRLPSR